MNIKDDDLIWARNQTKPRLRPRSTYFADGFDKQEKRQQRRLSEKNIISEEIDEEIEADEELDGEFENFDHEYWKEINKDALTTEN